ncbi:MAG: hypothetical protein WDZ41_04545 [Candidatus Babeliales bacterium]
MKISNRHVYFVFIIIGSFFCLLSKQFNEQSKKSNPCSTILNELTILEENTWKGLEPYGISKEKCVESQKTEYEQYLQESKPKNIEPISDITKKVIQPILTEFGLDANFPLIKSDRYLAAAIDHWIYIDESQFLALPKNVQSFVIAHEIQHVLHQDHSTISFMKNLLPENEKYIPKNQLNYDHPYLAYCRFTEMRADILVATKNTQWAERYHEFADYMLQLMNGDVNGPAHPQNSERLQLAQNIKQQFAGLQQA